MLRQAEVPYAAVPRTAGKTPRVVLPPAPIPAPVAISALLGAPLAISRETRWAWRRRRRKRAGGRAPARAGPPREAGARRGRARERRGEKFAQVDRGENSPRSIGGAARVESEGERGALAHSLSGPASAAAAAAPCRPDGAVPYVRLRRRRWSQRESLSAVAATCWRLAPSCTCRQWRQRRWPACSY